MKRTWLHLVLIALVTCVFYARSVDNYWIKDDLAIGNFTIDGEISWDLLSREFWPDYMESEHYWRPIPLLPGIVENHFWGLNPAGYHIDNILMHALVAILLYFLANRLTGDANRLIGVGCALLFALDPINAEAVVWIMQRMVIICLGMSACGLLCWLNAAEGRGALWRIPGLLFLALALLSKEIALTLPGLYFLIDLFYKPVGADQSLDFKAAFKRALPCALLLVTYFVCRHLMWGQVVNTYAGLSPWDYARENQVFEGFLETLSYGFAPVNAGMFSQPATIVLRGIMLSCFSVAVLRALVLVKTNPVWRRFALFSLAVIVLGLLPILPICWVDENLFNGRFFYQPSFGFLMLVVGTLLMPFKPGAYTSHFDALVGRTTLGFLLLASAISLGGGLVAFDHGGQQVRGLQQSILEYSDKLEASGDKDVTIVVLYTPTQYQGVPTLEYSLELALRPPLARREVRCIPLLSRDFLTPGKWPDELAVAMKKKGVAFEDLRWVKCTSKPLGVTAYFGGQEPALGAHPASLLSPPNHSFLRNDGPEPAYRFKAADEAHSFRIRFQVPSVKYEWGPKLVPGVNCERSGDGIVTFKPSFKDPSQPTLPDLWEKMMRQNLRHPMPMTWRVASYDQAGKLIGVSTDFKTIVLNCIEKN